MNLRGALGGLARGVQKAADIGIEEVIYERRRRGLLEAQKELAAIDNEFKMGQIKEKGRLDLENTRLTGDYNLKNTGLLTDAQQKISAADNASTESVARINAGAVLGSARIGAEAKTAVPQFDAGSYTIEKPAVDELGRQIMTTDSQGNPVPLMQKVTQPAPFNKFTGQVNLPGAAAGNVDVPDELLSRLAGGTNIYDMLTSQTQAPAGGLLRNAQSQVKPPVQSAPLMRQGVPVSVSQPEQIYRRGQLVSGQ